MNLRNSEKKAKQGFLTEDEVETLMEIISGTHTSTYITENSNLEELKRLVCFALAGAAFPGLRKEQSSID